MSKNLIPLLLVFTVLVSCSSNSSEQAHATKSLIKTDTLLTLALDSTTANISPFLTYYDDGLSETGYLFSVNTMSNAMQLYDLDSQRLVRTVRFDVEGERGVGKLESLFVQDFDNILLFPSQANRIFLVNATASIFEKLEYEIPEVYTNAQISSSFFAGTPYLKNGYLTVKTKYPGNYRAITNEELAKVHVAYIIDLRARKSALLPHYFPPDYYAQGMKHVEFSSVHSPLGAVYSFFGDHHLYYADQINQPLQKKEAKSQYFNQTIAAFPATGDRQDRAQYYAASAHYGSLLYDRYRKVYYRFCYPEVDIDDIQALRTHVQYPQKFSILMLDEQLNIIGETLFDNNKELVPQNAFVGKKGLYLSTNHTGNPQNEEGFFKFRLLVVE